jgi:hypothetical protein
MSDQEEAQLEFEGRLKALLEPTPGITEESEYLDEDEITPK